MDDAQLSLLQYAGWYKGIYGMTLEYRPDDEIIQDDERLDGWYKAFVRDIATKAGRTGNSRFALTGEEEQQQIPEFG
jgi:hypothetical protein